MNGSAVADSSERIGTDSILQNGVERHALYGKPSVRGPQNARLTCRYALVTVEPSVYVTGVLINMLLVAVEITSSHN